MGREAKSGWSVVRLGHGPVGPQSGSSSRNAWHARSAFSPWPSQPLRPRARTTRWSNLATDIAGSGGTAPTHPGASAGRNSLSACPTISPPALLSTARSRKAPVARSVATLTAEKQISKALSAVASIPGVRIPDRTSRTDAAERKVRAASSRSAAHSAARRIAAHRSAAVPRGPRRAAS